MKLEINLDNNWVNDYEDSLATLIKAEIDHAVRAEVTATIRKLVKDHLAGLKKQLEQEIAKTSPAKMAKLLGNLIEVNQLEWPKNL